MPVSVTMPRLGESVTEGTVTRWLKQEGDRVEADEPLLEVSTDKVDTEIPSPAAGVLSRIVVGEDETAEVGSELAVIAGDGEDAGRRPQARPRRRAGGRQPAEASPSREPAAPDRARRPRSRPSEEAAGARRPPRRAAPAAATGTAVKMPALGESVTEGTVTRWLKQVGDTVEVDEPLLEVSTDKVDTEIPSPVAGTLLEIKVAEDETADVGAELAVIGAAGRRARGGRRQPPQPEPPAARAAAAARAGSSRPRAAAAEPAAGARRRGAGSRAAAPPAAQAAPAAPAQPPRRPPSTVQANGAGDAGYVTPLVRKLAAEHGVDLSVAHRHRRRRPDPQAGRARRGRARPRRPRPRRPQPRRPPRAGRGRRPPKPAAEPAARPHREADPHCARPSPSAWSSRCRSRRSSPRWSRSTSPGSPSCATRPRPTSWPSTA